MRRQTPSFTSSFKAALWRYARFPLGFAAGLALSCAVWAGLNLARLHQKLNNDTAYWCTFIDYKSAKAKAARSPKVLVVGASNVEYGIRASLLQSELDIPVINFGQIASLGPGIILDTVESVAKPGDLIVLSLEHFFFTGDYTDGVSATKALFSCKTDALFHLPIGELLFQVFAQPAGDVLEGLGRRFLPWLGFTSAYPAIKLQAIAKHNVNGDYTEALASTRTLEMVSFVKAHPAGTTFKFSRQSRGAKAVERLARWARQNGVKVVVAWPSVYWPDYNDAVKAGFEAQTAFYRSLGFPVLGSHTDGMTPLDTFYNTNNHLTAEAAVVRTTRLATALRPFTTKMLQARSGGCPAYCAQ